jgi:hypothetical protein
MARVPARHQPPVFGTTIGVGVELVLVLVLDEPTIGLDAAVAGGAVWPSGTTMGVAFVVSPLLPPPLSLLESESELSCGGQSTDVGGQLSVLPEPDDELGGGQPEPAPKSPAPVQSAPATPAGITTIQPASETAAIMIRNRPVIA